MKSGARSYCRLREARVALRRAGGLHDEERVSEALDVYDSVVASLHGDDCLPARGRTAEALFLKSQALFDLGEIDAALTLVDGLVARYAVDDIPLRRRVMHTLFMTVFLLNLQHPERAEIALALCATAVSLFGDNTDACVRDRLLSLFVEQGRVLERLGRMAEGRALAEDIKHRYDFDPSWGTRALDVAEKMAGRFATTSTP